MFDDMLRLDICYIFGLFPGGMKDGEQAYGNGTLQLLVMKPLEQSPKDSLLFR